jgi:hypothetical protein
MFLNPYGKASTAYGCTHVACYPAPFGSNAVLAVGPDNEGSWLSGSPCVEAGFAFVHRVVASWHAETTRLRPSREEVRLGRS